MTPAAHAVALEPALFGPPERPLFGLYYRPREPRPTAALLCNPFGHEAIRAQRFYRVLADRLAAQGHPVLRFDYHGTGDAPGDDDGGDLDAWAGDVVAADAQLGRLSGAARRVWFGMRLGATLALRAAPAARPARLLLWDPVCDGARYRAELQRRHLEMLDEAFAVPPPRRPEDTDGSEALGFALSPRLRAQLDGHDAAAAFAAAGGVELVAIGDPAQPDGAALERLAGARFHALAHGVDWTSESADNQALVPPQALLLVTRSVAA